MTACSRHLVAAALLLGALPLQGGLMAEDGGDSRDVEALLGCIPAEFRQYKVVLEPDRNEPELWAYAEVARTNEPNEIRLFRLPCSEKKP